MSRSKLTTPQSAALARLCAELPRLPRSPLGYVVTGCNTTVLWSLRKKGFVACTQFYLEGHAAPDLAITEAGRAAVGAPAWLLTISTGGRSRKFWMDPQYSHSTRSRRLGQWSGARRNATQYDAEQDAEAARAMVQASTPLWRVRVDPA